MTLLLINNTLLSILLMVLV